MHDSLFYLVMSWLVLLVGLLAYRAVRARGTTDRVIALDTLSYVFVAALTVLAIERQLAGYLDVALMLALLSFTQAVAASRYVLAGRVTP